MKTEIDTSASSQASERISEVASRGILLGYDLVIATANELLANASAAPT